MTTAEIHVFIFLSLFFVWCLISMIVFSKLEQKEHES